MGRLEQPGGRVAGAGRLDDEPGDADRDQGIDDRAIHGHVGDDDANLLGRRGGRYMPAAGPSPKDRDVTVGQPPQGSVVEALERIQGRRVGLGDVVGGMHGAGQAGHDALPAEARRGRQGDRIPEVGRPVVARIGGGPHGPRDHDRLGVIEDEVPEEGRLLKDIGPLDHYHAVDGRVGLCLANGVADLEELPEGEMAGRRPPEIDDVDLGDAIEPGRRGDDRRAIEGRDVAPERGVDAHADGPAGEDRRDPAHRPAASDADSDAGAAGGPGGSQLSVSSAPTCAILSY